MTDKIVSIIVPVYNGELYLNKCIDSILNQTYKSIEVILINDGSTDCSGSICEEYAKDDNRVKVIQQDNLGPSASRNKGINIARGDYIQFVDSDDVLELNMTELLVKSMSHEFQLVICGYKLIYINGKEIASHQYIPIIVGNFDYSQFNLKFGELYTKGFINSLFNKLYVNNIIKKYNIRFDNNTNMGEDLLFNLDYITVCKNVIIIRDQLYNYMKINNNSLTSRFKEKLYENQQMLFRKVEKLLLKNNCYKIENQHYVEITYLKGLIGCFENIFHKESNLTSKDKKEEIGKIVNDAVLRRNIQYFKTQKNSKYILGILIKFKLINTIYLLFSLRSSYKKEIY
ncbi:glycosyltransferase family 2 protein [Psychrobacillus sp. NPDC096426]|uniref:glycosyltransferase family 2 protein n=1 Tax=Psychrobacillus sp. NPDC096426 TaxID=3364491 RepID=UPI00380FAF8E